MRIQKNCNKKITSAAAAAALAIGLSTSAIADNTSTDSLISGPWATKEAQLRFGDASNYLLAQASSSGSGSAAASSGAAKKPGASTEVVEGAWYGANNMHKYMGLASLGSALLAATMPKEKGGAHEYLADASLGFGALALATGAYVHWGDLDFTLSDPDTKHAILGTLGVLGFAAAVSEGGKAGHAGAGAAGALAMYIGIRYEW